MKYILAFIFGSLLVTHAVFAEEWSLRPGEDTRPPSISDTLLQPPPSIGNTLPQFSPRAGEGVNTELSIPFGNPLSVPSGIDLRPTPPTFDPNAYQCPNPSKQDRLTLHPTSADGVCSQHCVTKTRADGGNYVDGFRLISDVQSDTTVCCCCSDRQNCKGQGGLIQNQAAPPETSDPARPPSGCDAKPTLEEKINCKLGAAKASTYGNAGIAEFIGGIIKMLLGILGVLFLAMLLYAGFQWLTAQGDEKKIGGAIGIINHAVLGLTITVAAYSITVYVLNGIQAAVK